MALVTIRVLDGPERGQAFHNISTPVSIGREEGNTIQLNDERVSRYHLKIHENGGVILLTDLQSTNGTRINGETVQVWQLRPGDLISAGHSLFVFGSSDEIVQRLAICNAQKSQDAVPMGNNGDDFSLLNRPIKNKSGRDWSTDFFALEIFHGLNPEELAPLHRLAFPSLPSDLSPHQTAQLAELLQYLHLRLRYLVATVHTAPGETQNGAEGTENARITLAAEPWQSLLDLHDKIAQWLDNVANS